MIFILIDQKRTQIKKDSKQVHEKWLVILASIYDKIV